MAVSARCEQQVVTRRAPDATISTSLHRRVPVFAPAQRLSQVSLVACQLLIRTQDVNAGEVAPFRCLSHAPTDSVRPCYLRYVKILNQDPWALRDGLLGRGSS